MNPVTLNLFSDKDFEIFSKIQKGLESSLRKHGISKRLDEPWCNTIIRPESLNNKFYCFVNVNLEATKGYTNPTMFLPVDSNHIITDVINVVTPPTDSNAAPLEDVPIDLWKQLFVGRPLTDFGITPKEGMIFADTWDIDESSGSQLV